MPKLMVTNGDAAVERLKAAAIAGRLLPWQDMLHDGPVPAGDVLDDVSDTRADFLAGALGLPVETVRADFARRDAQIDTHAAYDEVELWFEHDLFDQLQLIQLLHFFSHEPDRMGLFLVQADHYIGVMDEGAVRRLAEFRRPVTQLQLQMAHEAWEAFTAPTPTALAAFAAAEGEEHHHALPYLVPALRRLLAELPAPKSGLSLTEQRILEKLAEGPMKVAQVYGAVHSMDEAQFLADLPFFLRLDGLAFTHEPLITGLPYATSDCGGLTFSPGDDSTAERTYRAYAAAEISLTRAGMAALRGQFDHACENIVERSMGGFQVMPGAMWRYDRDRKELLVPN